MVGACVDYVVRDDNSVLVAGGGDRCLWQVLARGRCIVTRL